ncbi:hypothetical protein [Francisella sp. TX07-6608]|uniref:hypothetical protein n=1 Tax=Francisella sp. TX07-6608 TaxID=573568 RepID=UPI0009221B66|nr:hypothetical protein [Francisella sp. TX07-6608]OIN84541.1 hypothetical protein KX00_1683 [Francisella sp. TX07-6608]
MATKNFSFIIALLFSFVFVNANTISNLEIDSSKLYKLPKNYHNINDLDDITKKTFKPSLYIAINGGWGQQTNMSKGSGNVVANLGYRFSNLMLWSLYTKIFLLANIILLKLITILLGLQNTITR